MGPGSGRWLGRVDPTAIGVVNGVVGSRDSVSIARAGLIQVVGFFFLVSGWKAAFGKPPAPVEPFRATGRFKGGCLFIGTESELSVTSARREITPRFRVHRRETGPRPSVWRSRPTRESKNRSAPRDSTDAHGVSDRTRARKLFTRALDFEIGLRVTHSDGSGRVIISDGRKLAPPWKVRGRASDLLRPADGRAPSRAHGGPGGLQGVGDQDPGSRRR